jgi:hypothetical protein
MVLTSLRSPSVVGAGGAGQFSTAEAGMLPNRHCSLLNQGCKTIDSKFMIPFADRA